MRVVCDQHDRFATWAEQKLQTKFFPPLSTIGIEDQSGEIAGAIVFNCYTGSDIELTIVAPGALQRGVCQAMAHYVFVQLGCLRSSISVRASDEKTRALAMRCGFTFEGIKREFFDGEDAILYGMLRSDCRWLKGSQNEISEPPISPGP